MQDGPIDASYVCIVQKWLMERVAQKVVTQIISLKVEK